MKRAAEEDAEEGGRDTRRRKLVVGSDVRRKARGHHEQRETVEAPTSKMAALPNPAQSSRPTPSSSFAFLTTIRSMAPGLLSGKTPVKQLVDAVVKNMVMAASDEEFDGECEAMVLLQYVALTSHHPNTWLSVKNVVYALMRRWTSWDSPSGIHKWQYSGPVIAILLFANLDPAVWNLLVHEVIEDYSNKWMAHSDWPVWLINATGSQNHTSDLVLLLRLSAGHHNPLTVSVQDDYLGAIINFLIASRHYKDGRYRESLEVLHSITLKNCDSELKGWVCWITGLCQVKTEAPFAALVTLQEAVNLGSSFHPAVYNMSQIYSAQGKTVAEISTLALIGKRMVRVKRAGVVMTLQTAILSLQHHHQPPEDVHQRALALLALQYLQDQKYTEASEHFVQLAGRLNTQVEVVETGRSLLREEDFIPRLPALPILSFLTALSHSLCGSYKAALEILEGRYDGEGENGDRKTYEADEAGKMTCVTLVAWHLLELMALVKLDRTSDAVKQCVRLEQGTLWVSGMVQSRWDAIVLKMRELLLVTLGCLYGRQGDQASQHHYRRRAAQCRREADGCLDEDEWGQHLSRAERVLVETLMLYVNECLKAG